MNTIVTSKEEILKTSRALIQEQGWSAVSIRSVAAACGVSVGSIYNYFDSKAELVSATVESVWREIFHRPEDAAVFQDVQACVIWVYERMAYGYEQYPGFFTLHSLGFMRDEKADGKRHMQQAWHHMLMGLCAVLRQDARIRPLSPRQIWKSCASTRNCSAAFWLRTMKRVRPPCRLRRR